VINELGLRAVNEEHRLFCTTSRKTVFDWDQIDRVTALTRPCTLDIDQGLTFNPRQAVVMTHAHTKLKFNVESQSVQKI